MKSLIMLEIVLFLATVLAMHFFGVGVFIGFTLGGMLCVGITAIQEIRSKPTSEEVHE